MTHPFKRRRDMRVEPAELKLVETKNHGQIGCGKVVEFSRSVKTIVAIRPNDSIPDTFIACGDSLEGRGIADGDTLLVRAVLSLGEVHNRVCIVRVNGEFAAKIVWLNTDNTVTLKSANPYYADKTVDGDDVEILGIVFARQIPVE